MPKYVTIGYGDRAGYEQTAQAVRDAAHQHDDWLVSNGALMGMAGEPVQVRNHDGAGVARAAGAYLQSELPVAGFAIIEATDLDAAVELASKSPCAVAQGVIEVWPLG